MNDSHAVRAAAREAERAIDRGRDGSYADPLKPLPLFSLESLMIALTMDGRYPLIALMPMAIRGWGRRTMQLGWVVPWHRSG